MRTSTWVWIAVVVGGVVVVAVLLANRSAVQSAALGEPEPAPESILGRVLGAFGVDREARDTIAGVTRAAST